jgi:hypothetical protein
VSTLMFDENVVPIAKIIGESKYRMNSKELSGYVAGFVEGWGHRAAQSDERARELRNKVEYWRDTSETLWRGAIEALLLMDPKEEATQVLHRALAASKARH